MQTELLSLSKIFTENLFRIPDYQRGYSWTDKQLKDFWSDLILLDDQHDHYTGVLTLEQVANVAFDRWTDDLWIIQSKRFTPYYVVDGQQRLTTSLLLLQSLLERTTHGETLNYTSVDEIRKKFIFESKDGGVSRSYIFGYEKDNPSYEFLKTKIFMERSDNHEIGEDTIYTHNLSSAKAFFLAKLTGMGTGDLERLYTKLTQHFLFNIYTIAGGIDVFVAFETMNNRGKPLSHLELLKNRLIFLSTRLSADAIERAKVRTVVNESWKTVYHYLGRNQKNPLDDDLFLHIHFVLYFGPTLIPIGMERSEFALFQMRQQEQYKDYLLDRLFTSRNLQRGADADGCAPNPDVVDGDESSAPLSVQTIYDYAHDLKHTVQRYYQVCNPADSEFSGDQKVILTQLNRIGSNEALALALAAAELGAMGAEFTDLLRQLERSMFLRLIRHAGEVFNNDPMLLALRLKQKSESVTTVAEKLRKGADQRVAGFEWSAWSADLVRRRGYYGWRGIRYLLFEYEQDLKRRTRSKRDKILWEEFVSEDYEHDFVTVEHVYPQRPADAYWKKQFQGLNPKQKAALRNSLGNLVALSHPKNAALGNRPFPEKKKGVGDTLGYSSGSYSEIEVSQQDDWDPHRILERGIRMLAFMEKRWKINIGDRAKKVQALGLRFMLSEAGDDELHDEGIELE